jgi:hypothetical protein
MADFNPVNLSGILKKDYSKEFLFYLVDFETNEVKTAKLEEITDFLISNSELSVINAKLKDLKSKTQAFMDKMLNTYMTIELAEREYDKNQTVETTLESTIKTIDDLNSALKDIASKSYIDSLQEQTINVITETKRKIMDVGDSEGRTPGYGNHEEIVYGVENKGGYIMKKYLVDKAKEGMAEE